MIAPRLIGGWRFVDVWPILGVGDLKKGVAGGFHA